MIETEEQRRWWFATHPEYSWSRRGAKRSGDKKEKKDSDKVSPEAIDACVDSALKRETNETVIELLKILKFWCGTEFASKSPAEQEALLKEDEFDWDADDPEDEFDDDWWGQTSGQPDAAWDRTARAGAKNTPEGVPAKLGEGTRFEYQDGKLTVYNAKGEIIGTIPASSGQPGVTDPSIPWLGPIPPGKYTLYPSEISKAGLLRNVWYDWGLYRVPLHPEEGTNTYGRKNFFLHGGTEPGTAGCIAIGNADKELFPLLMKLKGPIRIEVK